MSFPLIPRTMGFRGALDALAANMVHLYCGSRRWLKSHTTAVVRVRNDTTQAEADFACDVDGEVDNAAIVAWLAGATGKRVTIYDQRGTDAITQGTAAAQPVHMQNGQNGHAVGFYDGVDDYIQGAFTNGGVLSQPLSVYMAILLETSKVDNNTTLLAIDGVSVDYRCLLYKSSTMTPDHWAMSGGIKKDGKTCDDLFNVWSSVFDGDASNYWVNAVQQIAADADTGDRGQDGLTIGGKYDGANAWRGMIDTLIFCNSHDDDAVRLGIVAVLAAYWGVTLT